MTTTVRETQASPLEKVRADQLVVGQFLADDELVIGRPTEVLFTHTYPGGNGELTLIVHRPLGSDWSEAYDARADRLYPLATAADVEAAREAGRRAAKIADIRAVADFLERHPDVPLPDYPSELVHLHGEDDVARVRELGRRYGATVDDLEDRTKITLKIGGSFEYDVIAWHRDGRPAEADEVATARADTDPTGLLHSRADDEADDPTPVSPSRVPLHAGAMVGPGDGQLVDATAEFDPGVDCQSLGFAGQCIAAGPCVSDCRGF